MENKASKKIKILMVVILLVFLVPSAIDFVASFSKGVDAFKKGMEAGVESTEKGLQRFLIRIDPVERDDTARWIGDYRFETFHESGELLVPENLHSPWWIDVVNVLLSFIILISLVLFLVLLIRFAVKLPRRQIMAGETIHSLRRIAYTLGILSLAGYLMELTHVLWLKSHISLEGYEIRLGTPPSALIVALIILLMTEVLKLGRQLKQEQDLTI